jgi:radical SAM protein with 4Fe4S-binding SPASM domain
MAPRGACVFLAEPEEFSIHPWFGEVNLLYVDADGTVVPCCMHPQAGVFGSLRTHKFSEILNGEGRRRMKEEMAKNRASMPICGTCDVGPVGREGPSYWSTIDDWTSPASTLPER